jgi:BioD-like phosphotransacetylase family protein
VAKSAKSILISSLEPLSGKSGTVVGLAHLLRQKGLEISYGKPVGNCPGYVDGQLVDEDVEFIRQLLELSPKQLRLPVIYTDVDSVAKRLQGTDKQDYGNILAGYLDRVNSDIILLEGPGTLWEGSIFQLSILLVARYSSPLIAESLLKAREELNNQLLGVVISDIPADDWEEVQSLLKPYLARQGVEVLGLLPASKLLRSISVREIVHLLGAKVLCRPDRLDWMVESLAIGAMNVNAALEYFRKGENMAVITGGDRTDLQLAALETSTTCLILTGSISPDPLILGRAEDLEVPILSVNLDTLTTVEIVDQAFGKIRLQEQVKVACIRELMEEHFQIDRLLEKLTIGV